MLTGPTIEAGNCLIDDLPNGQFRDVTGKCELVELKLGQVLCEKDRLISHVYFPVFASISMVAMVSNHPPMSVVQIGSEGLLGATLILGVPVAPLRAIVQGPGTALRMDVKAFHRCLQENPALPLIVGRYLASLLEQIAQSAACTCFHDVQARLVRWLLLTHDRAHGDHFHLTHQTLADMLGIQRSAVTIAAGALQQRGLISYSRGDIWIINRAGLIAICCDCYEIAAVDCQRLTA